MDRQQRFMAILACIVFPGTGQFMAGQAAKGGFIQLTFVATLFYLVLARPELLPQALLIPGMVWLYSLVDILYTAARTRS